MADPRRKRQARLEKQRTENQVRRHEQLAGTEPNDAFMRIWARMFLARARTKK